MGIRKWSHRGQEKLVLSKIWPDRTRFRRFMPNRTVAKQLETRIDYAVATGSWPQLKEELTRGQFNRSSNPTIGEFADQYLQYCRVNNRRPDFKEQALVSIVKILGEIRVKDLKRRDAERFKEARLAEGLRPATINRGLAVLRHMLTVAVEREYLPSNPLLRYRMLQEVQVPLRILTYSEYRRLIESVAKEDSIIGAYVAVLGETGMRRSEGLRLRWEDIRLQESIVLIGEAKSGKVRSVPLSELALEWLEKLIRFIHVPHVFVNPATGAACKKPRGPFERGRARAGVPWVGLHGLRHFRATQWLMNGVDVNTVKELLGHSDIHTTMRYVHYVQSHASKSVVLAQKKEVEEWEQAHASVDTKWRQAE